MDRGEHVTLLDAVGRYVGSRKGDNGHQRGSRELHRFVAWCGPDRPISGLTPLALEAYAEQLGASAPVEQTSEHVRVVRGFLAFAFKAGLTSTNLAPHVRLRRGKTPPGALRHVTSRATEEMTQEGHARLVDELAGLKAERPSIAAQIRKAAADKDVRENAPLEAAREQLGHLESRIRNIEGTLLAATIITDGPGVKAARVKRGTRVVIRDLDSGLETAYTVVGAAEAEPMQGRISDASPVGKALMGQSEGQDVEVQTPGGRQRYHIAQVTL